MSLTVVNSRAFDSIQGIIVKGPRELLYVNKPGTDLEYFPVRVTTFSVQQPLYHKIKIVPKASI